MREHAQLEVSARLESANQFGITLRSLQKENQDLKAEAQSLRHQLELLAKVHSNGPKSPVISRAMHQESMQSVETAAEQKIIYLESEHNKYRQEVNTEMKAAVEQVARSQVQVSMLEGGMQECKEDALEANELLRRERLGRASQRPSPKDDPSEPYQQIRIQELTIKRLEGHIADLELRPTAQAGPAPVTPKFHSPENNGPRGGTVGVIPGNPVTSGPPENGATSPLA